MELWLVVGREMHQNKLKHVCLLSNTGKRKMMTVNQLSTFSNKNKVVNVKAYGEQLQGVGISLLSIPTYKKDPTGQMVQISGTSEQAIISAAQPFINKIMEEEQRKEARKNAPDADKESKINFIIDKLQLCYNILNELENTKSLTNEKLLIERVSRYTKQLDIDNADDSIQNNVTRYGITGLVKSVDTRISRCKERAKKYNLLKENIRERTGFDTIQSLCEMMFQKVENVKKQHKITYDLIKEGKGRQAEAEEESTPKAFEFKKEQMAKVDHYVGEYTNTNNYFSEDRFKQILKDYKQYLVDIVNNNKIDSSWTYVKCRTSDGRKANIIDLDANIQNINSLFQRKLDKYTKEQENENVNTSDINDSITVEAVEEFVHRLREEQRQRDEEMHKKFERWDKEEEENKRKYEEEMRQWREQYQRQQEEERRQQEEERRQREEEQRQREEEERQKKIAERDAKFNNWLQEEEAKREEIIRNANQNKKRVIREGTEAIRRELNGTDGPRFKYIMYHLLKIEKTCGKTLEVGDLTDKEIALCHLVKDKLIEEDREKGVFNGDIFDICDLDRHGRYGSRAILYVEIAKDYILKSRGIDTVAYHLYEQEKMDEAYSR